MRTGLSSFPKTTSHERQTSLETLWCGFKTFGGSQRQTSLETLWCVVLRGAEVVCKALVGTGTDGSDERQAGEPRTESTTDETYFTCYERVEDIGQGKETLEEDTELRMSHFSKKVYLPESENDTLLSVKLSAVRQAFELIVGEPESRRCLQEAGHALLGGLLSFAGKKAEGFGLVWEQLMAFAENPTNWSAITEECQEAGMQTVCFYDIFYESIVLKLLECTEHIPPTLMPTLRTPWISVGMKKTTVMFYAWSQIRRKKEHLMRAHGLYHHLYEVFDYIDPEIMWAAFGAQSQAKDYYFLLRGQVLSFIRHIFSLDRRCYDSPARLKVPIYSEWQKRVCLLQRYLEENLRRDKH